MNAIEKAKEAAALAALELVQDGMKLGLGTGSTAKHLVAHLGIRVAQGLKVRCVATSIETYQQAKALSIPLFELDELGTLDLAIDGADEITPSLDMLKGLGAALFREKLVAVAAKAFCCIADDTKLVNTLGGKPLPVEVVPFAWGTTKARLEALGCVPVLRMKDEKPVVTDNGNLLLDCKFESIEDPTAMGERIKSIVGVCEHGIFPRIATSAFLARPDGSLIRLPG